ncbi:MAG: sugar transferase [Patescibacteria group bacterium]
MDIWTEKLFQDRSNTMLYSAAKRGVDIVGALAGLALIAPIAPIIAVAIKLESKGSVLVTLPRVSRGKLINVYKFRSMIDGAHAMKTELTHLNERIDGPFFKMRHDPRVTRVGRIIRKFRFDEFPQLLNVLKGDLSLVGPRPHEVEEIIHYPHPYKHLMLAKAGVTGLSQINGASSLPFLKELEYDSGYLEEQSLSLDVQIIAKTLGIFFRDHNAV